ncbi:hypothetical protein G9U51_12465 [Calidifontibacter sp. DB0510]|uniref:Uncharacterized protein n=1 Tax=Metallococcus carri TaxID=1656884 RepID=A0A967B304_9MICO|nr:hypothetical protein [Metallococcus carri]NHN56593.1 hypothetical protein [Metallococcus carri]NOP38892.1 hypothetical protein [Calidifontibacter sp. DB2511S]
MDRTPLRGRHVDVDARTAWLLRVSRMGSPLGGTGDSFTARLAAAGFSTSGSVISRRESALDDIPRPMIGAYEQALELPAGTLLGPIAAMRRSLGDEPLLARPPHPRDQAYAVLSRTDELIAAGTMTGADWLTFAEAVIAADTVFLPPSVMSGWVRLLVSELMRSVRVGYATRLETLSVMISNPHTHRTVVAEITRAAGAEGAQGVADIIAVLGDALTATSLTQILDFFLTGTAAQRWGATYALLQPISTGSLKGDHVDRVREAAMQLASTDAPDAVAAAYKVAQRMSPELSARVLRLSETDPPAEPAGARLESPAGLEAFVQAGAELSGLDDQMFERLLREALSTDFVERRTHSSMLLAVSPYRQVVADVAVEQLGSADATRRSAAGHLLSFVVTAQQATALLPLLNSPAPDVRAHALRALAHAGGVPESVDLRAQVADPATTDAAMYAAGMSGSALLEELADDQSDGIRAARARWWQAAGSAVHL